MKEKVHAWFIQAHQTLALAESCTGGRLAAALTQIPGASAYFQGSVVAYSNEMKERLLGVKGETLAQHGAVSREVVLEMLTGVLERTGADRGVAVTGIAGPTGGSPQKPVGTIWVAFGGKEKKPFSETFVVQGNRLEVMEEASNYILKSLLSYLLSVS